MPGNELMNYFEVSIKCLETDEDIFSLKTSWEELHKNSVVSSVYNSFVFIFESIQAFKNSQITHKVFTLTDDNTSQLIAIFPLQKLREKWKFIPFSSYQYTALNDFMDKPFPVIRNGFHDRSWQAFFLHLKNNVIDWSHLSLRDIPASYPVLELLPKICRENDFIYNIEYDSDNPQINLAGDWNKFWLKHRNLRKKTRKLEKDFGDRLSFVVFEDNWQWCLDQYIELERKTWKKGLGVSRDERTISFYTQLCKQLNDSDNVIFGFMSVDDQLISAEIAYPYGDTVYFPQACFDPAYKKYSPSMVSTGYLIRYLMGKDYSRGDYLCGYAHYLNSWSDSIIQTYEIDIYNKRPVVRLIFTLRSIKDNLLKPIKKHCTGSLRQA